VLDEEECFVDATVVMAKGGGANIGATRRGKGMKIMAIVDRHGLPLSVSAHPRTITKCATSHHRCKPPTQDRRRLRRYMRRWLVERFFAWIQWQRRILVRWEYHTQNFLGFVQLACLVILFRRF
jgi:hypothetical protein